MAMTNCSNEQGLSLSKLEHDRSYTVILAHATFVAHVLCRVLHDVAISEFARTFEPSA